MAWVIFKISWPLKETVLPVQTDLDLAAVARVASKASTDQMRFLFQRHLEGREPRQSEASAPWWMLGGVETWDDGFWVKDFTRARMVLEFIQFRFGVVF